MARKKELLWLLHELKKNPKVYARMIVKIEGLVG